MLHFSIFGYIFIGLLATLFIVWGIRLLKVNKQPHNFDMSTLVRRQDPVVRSILETPKWLPDLKRN